MLKRKWIIDNVGRLVAVWSECGSGNLMAGGERPPLIAAASVAQDSVASRLLTISRGGTRLRPRMPALIRKLVLIPYGRSANR